MVCIIAPFQVVHAGMKRHLIYSSDKKKHCSYDTLIIHVHTNMRVHCITLTLHGIAVAGAYVILYY